MLAAIALCLATTIILKMQLRPISEGGAPRRPGLNQPAENQGLVEFAPPKQKPALVLITFIPLIWLVAVTFTAGADKIWSANPRIGFLAQAQTLAQKTPALQKALDDANLAADATAIGAAQKALGTNHTLRFNNVLDAVVTGIFLALVTAIIFISVYEWFLLLTRRKPAVLYETEPVWLPDYAVAEGGRKFSGAAGAAALALALAKDWSGEADLERAQQQAQAVCKCHATAQQATAQQIYVKTTEQRFNGVRRCC